MTPANKAMKAAEIIKAHLKTPEGRKALKDSIKESKRRIARLNELRKVSWERLHRPTTI